jgi:hypothetical protein
MLWKLSYGSFQLSHQIQRQLSLTLQVFVGFTHEIVQIKGGKKSFQMSYQTSSFDRYRRSYGQTTFCRHFYVETLSFYWSYANIALLLELVFRQK